MSATLFPGPPGIVIAIPDPAAQGVLPLVTLNSSDGGSSLSFQGQKTLITGISTSDQANFQFLHTLGGDIYLYVFGDRIGQMTISGICVAANSCENEGMHGLEYVRKYYKTNRLSTNPKPLTVLIGQSTTITGFLGGLQTSIVDPKLSLGQFSLSLLSVPD